MIYIKNNDIDFISLEGEGEVAFSNKEEKVHILNEVGKDILKLCDGINAVEDIIAILSKEYETKDNEIKDDVDFFIKELIEKDLIHKVIAK